VLKGAAGAAPAGAAVARPAGPAATGEPGRATAAPAGADAAPAASDAAPAIEPPPGEPPAGKPESDGLRTIEAPMLGTFYRAEGPGQKPFVEVGDEVEADSIVCIIEVMKMMNSVPAGTAGTIVEVCRENAQMVEYGDPLFRVQPR